MYSLGSCVWAFWEEKQFMCAWAVYVWLGLCARHCVMCVYTRDDLLQYCV